MKKRTNILITIAIIVIIVLIVLLMSRCSTCIGRNGSAWENTSDTKTTNPKNRDETGDGTSSSKEESLEESKKEESSKKESTAKETTVAVGEDEPTSKAADETTAPASSASEATTTTPAGTTKPAETTVSATATVPATTTVAPTTVAPTAVAPTTVTPTTTATSTITPTNVSPDTSTSKNPSSTAHEHTWVEQTKVVHHDAEYQTVSYPEESHVVHHDAIYETVTVKEGWWEEVWDEREIVVYNKCGEEITNSPKEHSFNRHDGKSIAYHTDSIWTQLPSIWHEPVTEQRLVNAAWDETVIDSPARTEQVLVKAAWDETVVTGYKCSGCGATK